MKTYKMITVVLVVLCALAFVMMACSHKSDYKKIAPNYDDSSMWVDKGTNPSTTETDTAENKDTVIQISNAQDLRNISRNYNAAYCLTSDIDLNGTSWTPIGIDENQYFSGKLDGNGYAISNFTISGNYRYLGLFGYTTGTFYDMSVEGFTITSNSNATVYIGGLAGVLFGGTIKDVFVDGRIIINNSTSNVRAGLLAAMNKNGIIKSAYSVGSITSTVQNNSAVIGGLVAWNQQPSDAKGNSIEGCFSVADLVCLGNNTVLGNVIGYNDGIYNKLFFPISQVVTLNGVANNSSLGQGVAMTSILSHSWARDALGFDSGTWQFDYAKSELIKLIKQTEQGT